MDFEYLKNNAIKQTKDWNFSTRTNKKDFWSFILVLFVLSIINSIIITPIAAPIAGLISLAINIISIPVAIRRCHDINKSGWTYGLPFIIVGGMLLLAGILGGSAAISLITAASTGSVGFGTASLAGLGAAAGVLFLTMPVAVIWGIYLIVQFVKPSYDKENKWGPVPTEAKKETEKTESK